jgi:hypothetical protein
LSGAHVLGFTHHTFRFSLTVNQGRNTVSHLLKLAASAAVLLVFVSTAQAQERLRPMGEITYEPEPASAEKGVFEIKNPRDQRLRSFKIEMDVGSAEIRDIRIIYADGGRERIRIRQSLTEGQATSLVRLQEDEPVAAIEVTYVPKGAVTLLLQGDSGRREPPPPPPAQWAELGCKSVGFFADRDNIIVNTDNRFRALRLRSTGYDIELQEMSIAFGNGQRDNYTINRILPSGGVTNEIPLRGEARRIRQVDLLYRARTLSNKKTIVCVDGLQARPLDDGDN